MADTGSFGKLALTVVLLRPGGKPDQPYVDVLVPGVDRHELSVSRFPIDDAGCVEWPSVEDLHEMQVVSGEPRDDVPRSERADRVSRSPRPCRPPQTESSALTFPAQPRVRRASTCR